MNKNHEHRHLIGGRTAIQTAKKALLFLALSAFGSLAHGEVFLQTGFEGSTSLPAGWTQMQISGGATWAIQQGGRTGGANPAAAHGGTNNATLYLANTTGNKTQLLTPTFSTAGFTNLSLTFWHTQEAWSPDQDELKVFYSSDGGSNWTELAYYTTSVSAWTQRTLVLPTASANSKIAFEGNAKYGYGVCLDDVEVSGIPDTLSQVSVSATDASASEVGPDPGTWTITRSGNTTGALSVNYTLGGSATAGNDYNVNPASPIAFAAGETSKVVTLTPVDDTVGGEGDEIATLTLTAGSGYAIGTASANISIYDDEGFDLNILVIGSTHSFSEGGENDVVHEKPFNPTAIAEHLEQILAQDTVLNQSVKVVFEDVYKSKTNTVLTSSTGIDNITAHCYSLAQHFMWPDGKASRLSNLRSEAGTKWDYIVLCGDPYIMANFPGIHAEGVKLIQSEVAKTVVPQGQQAPAVVLLAQWPENSSTFSADDFNEVVHRIGGSAGLTVVPAGKVWSSYTSQDTNATHPTPKGEYLAAASIYSKLLNRSASTSGYNYTPGGDAIADHALSQIQTIAAAPQYSGTYTDINPFQMKYVSKRTVSFRETGSSTEDRLAEALHRLDDVCRMRFIQNQGTFWDFNYGRGNDRWEDDKDYEVNPAKHDRAYGFPIHHYYTGSAADAAAQTMPYGIDKYYFSGVYEDGTDLGIAYNMIRPNTRELSLPADVRAIPIRLLWMKMERAFPGFQPLGDNTHMGPYLNDASAAFMYTLLSGRCPVVDEPTPVGSAAWMQWLGHKTGYETAWQMSHLTTRAPGFRVLPSHVDATTVTTTAGETMTVRFMNPPQSNVTVSIASSNPGVATVSPSTLTFTPANYATPQNITVSGVAAESGLQNFNVLITSSSGDEIYDGLSDAWAYTSNTDSVSYGQTVLLAGFDGTNTANTTSGTAGVYKELTTPHKSSTSSANVNATFSTTDAVVNGLQWVGGMTSPSTWGSATYTPNATTTNTGVFVADNAITCSLLVQNTGTNQVTLEKLHFRLQRDNATGASPNQVTITLASGNLTASGPGVQPLSASSGAFNYDFDLSSILTDATLAPGESATFTLSFVPTDPAGINRRIRVDNLAIAGKVTESVPDNVAPTPNPMTWSTPPSAASTTAITMTASTASDASGVEYSFDETSGNPGGTDSGWQDSPIYTDTGLNPNTQYTYTVQARDKSVNNNPNTASSPASATTFPPDTNPPPTPGFSVPPNATSFSAITMTASTVTDPEGGSVEYFFTETSGNVGGSSSSWQSSPTYTDSGLNPNTQYTYTVKARDNASPPNESMASASASATTPELPASTTYVRQNTATLLNATGAWSSSGTPGAADVAAWTAAIATAGNRTTALGGSVSWGQILMNATDPGGDITIGNTASSTISLNGINGTGIDLSAAVRSLTINNPVALGSSQIWNVNTSRTVTVGNYAISDGGSGYGITKAGAGTLTLQGSNTFTGPLTATGGTVSINAFANGGSPSPLGQSSNAASSILLGNGTTLTYTGGPASSDRSFTINGTAAAHGATINAIGTGTLNLTSTSAIGYGTSDQTRTLILSGANNLANTHVLAAQITNNGSGAVTLSKTGTGSVWHLTNPNNSFTGGVKFNRGFLVFSSGALGTTGPITIDSNAAPPFGLRWAPGNTDDISSRFNNPAAGTGQVTLDTGSNDVVFANEIGFKADSWLIKEGSGSLTLNTASGWGSGVNAATLVNAGTLVAKVMANGGTKSSIGNTPNTALAFGLRGGALKYTGSGATTDRNFHMSGDNTIDASGTGALVFTQTAVVSPTPVSRNFNLTLNSKATGNAPSSSADLVPGMTVSGTGLPVGTKIASIGINGSLTFDQNATATGTGVTLTFGSYAAGTLTLTGTSLLANEIRGILRDSVSNIDASTTTLGIDKTGVGKWVLSGANTYTGPANLNGGTLALGANNVLPDSSPVSIGAATLDAATFTDTLGTLDVTGAATINLGSGAALAFAASNSVNSGTWSGTLNISGTFATNSIRFGINNSALTAGQLAKITVNSSGSYTLDSNGYLIAASVASAYNTWASAKGLTGLAGSSTDPAKDADPDKDGRNNLSEFAFNGAPLSGSDNGKLFALTEDSDFVGDPSSAKELILTVAVRSGTPAFNGSPLSATHGSDGITYSIEGSLDLAGFPTAVNVVPTPLAIGLPAPGEGYEYRSFSLDGSNGLTGKGFLRAKVTSP